MKNPLRRDTLKSLRDELAALDARRDALTKQLEEAVATLESTRNAAHAALLDGKEYDDAALAATERRVTLIGDAIAAMQDRREIAQAKIDEAEDRAAREAEAAAREKAAGAVEKTAARIDDLVATLAEEFDALLKAIPDCVEARVRHELHGDGPALSVDRVAAQIVADAFNKHMPTIFDREREELGGFDRATLRLLFRKPDASLAGVRFFAYPVPPALSAAESARDLVVNPLVTSAQRIRDGEDHAGASAPRDVAPHGSRNTYNAPLVDALATLDTPRANVPDERGLDWSGVSRPKAAE